VELLVGTPDGDHLSVEVVGRVHPGATDFWDGNWLTARISARAGAFHGAFVADLRADELERFAAQLRALEGAAEGKASLESAEGWVTLALALDARGRLVGSCELRDDPTGGAGLRFGLVADPSQRLHLLAALGALLEAFPVIGDPEAEGSTLLAALGGEDDDGAPGDA
jgi:hypothetical protein